MDNDCMSVYMFRFARWPMKLLGNAGLSVQPGVYVDSGVGFHEIEGVSKYIRVGQNPKQQTVETVIGQKLPPGNNRELSVEDKSQDSILRFLNRQILSVTGKDKSGAKKADSLFDNLSTELEVKIKLMTWEFQKTALAMKENFKNDSEREEALQTIEGDIDVKMSAIAKEFGETENAEQEPDLATIGDAIKRRMRLIFSNNVHYDKDNL
ncbi:uncharacterized protein LOC117121180 [Anneissia japonica]|uniref:uncharacterized protein LOC117121180 n=1 Tax=Anneissia japonica TaxID=1529436 RepID=UPI0014256F64|nr:uncharacterized protein LOC117121180 [Anneissia japonica]